MKLTSSEFNRDFVFGKVDFLEPASKEDMEEGIDAWLGGIPFAWRKRRISVKKYGEISIRYSRAGNTKTEYAKILDGSFKPRIYIFEFVDAIIICLTSDIYDRLVNKDYTIQSNPDNSTAACYIELSNIDHLIVKR